MTGYPDSFENALQNLPPNAQRPSGLRSSNANWLNCLAVADKITLLRPRAGDTVFYELTIVATDRWYNPALAIPSTLSTIAVIHFHSAHVVGRNASSDTHSHTLTYPGLLLSTEQSALAPTDRTAPASSQPGSTSARLVYKSSAHSADGRR
jgi:hypothetical protein